MNSKILKTSEGCILLRSIFMESQKCRISQQLSCTVQGRNNLIEILTKVYSM